mgnify:CR=1 FL=1
MIQNHATGKKNRDGDRKKFDRRKHDMELWDIYCLLYTSDAADE